MCIRDRTHVVLVATALVGVASHFDAQIRITLQDLDSLVQNRNGIRTQGRLVEVEVHALQVDRDRHRATVRNDGLTSLRTRALVVAVVDAIAVVIQIGAARSHRSRSNRSNRLRAQGHGQADASEQIGEGIFLSTGTRLLVIEIDTGADFGTQINATEIELQTGTQVQCQVGVFQLTRRNRVRGSVVFFLITLPANTTTQIGPPLGIRIAEVVTLSLIHIYCMYNGGKIAMLGIMPNGAGINWDKVIFKGLTLQGIYGRRMYETWYKMTQLILSGFPLGKVLTHQLPIDDFQKGFDLMEGGKSGKVVLSWN